MLEHIERDNVGFITCMASDPLESRSCRLSSGYSREIGMDASIVGVGFLGESHDV
jgi:hypothetical protein